MRGKSVRRAMRGWPRIGRRVKSWIGEAFLCRLLLPSTGGRVSPLFPIQAKLKDGSPVQLVLAGERDIEPLRALYRIIVEEGTSYPHDRFPDDDDFIDYWFRGKTTVAA